MTNTHKWVYIIVFIYTHFSCGSGYLNVLNLWINYSLMVKATRNSGAGITCVSGFGYGDNTCESSWFWSSCRTWNITILII